MCYNCGKDRYYASSYSELKKIGNIKEIKEDLSEESEKEEP